MKRALGRFLLSTEFQASVLGRWFRQWVIRTHPIFNYSLEFRVDCLATQRPHYAYCMLRAAQQARSLGVDRVSMIEFGVAGGNGLRFMERLAGEIEAQTGVAIECYGFDTGQGMPDPEDRRDLPYWFQRAQYVMDQVALQSTLTRAKLVIGPVAETIERFYAEYNPAPLACIFFDMDYYSSTRDSFKLFKSIDPERLLPRIITYFDDIIGTTFEMYGDCNGQLAAIKDFNAMTEGVKIVKNQNLLPNYHWPFKDQIYYIHLMDHPSYDRYIGGEAQEGIKALLKLRT